MILALLLFLLLLATVVTVITVLVLSPGRARADGRSLTTRFRESFLDIVPRPAKLIAYTLLCIASTIGILVGSLGFRNPAHMHMPILGAFLGSLMGLFIGSLFALWILGLGYVYADARRRNMPHIPWMLIAAIVPNLLGFLLYFVLRKPIASPCPQCGQPIAAGQRFCPACGYQALSHPAAAPPPQLV